MSLHRHLGAAAAVAALLLAAPPAFADPTTAGSELGPASSRSPIGFVPPSADTIDDYVRAVGAVGVDATFQASQKESLGSLDLAKGATVSVNVNYSKKPGAADPTFDGLTINTSGVTAETKVLGFNVGVGVKQVKVNADGSMQIAMGGIIPNIDISGIVKQPNGDMKVKLPGWLPYDVTITKSGDVVENFHLLFAKGSQKTVGHIDPNLLKSWPPQLTDLAPALMKQPAGNLPPLSALAGTLKWNVNADADGLPVTLEGLPVKAKESVQTSGQATIKNGQLTASGPGNTVHVQVDFGNQKLGDAKNSITLGTGTAKLDGTYQLQVPLDATAAQKMVLTFDGQGTWQASGNNLHVSLPNGGSASVAHVDLSRTATFHAGVSGKTFTLQDDNAQYSFDAQGPIDIQKVGPISKLDLDGTIRSQGTAKVGANGLLSLQGNASSDLQVESSGMLVLLDGQKGYYKASVTPGTKVSVNLDQVNGAVQLPLDGKSLAFEGAVVHGTASASGDLANVDVNALGAHLQAPGAHADLSATGQLAVGANGITPGTNDLKLDPNAVSGSGTVTAKLTPRSGTVTLNAGPLTGTSQISSGSQVAVNATVNRPAATPTDPAPATVVDGNVTATVGVQGAKAHATVGNVDLDVTGGAKTDLNAHFTAKIGAKGPAAAATSPAALPKVPAVAPFRPATTSSAPAPVVVTPLPVTPASTEPLLANGSTGPQVTALQNALKKAGFQPGAVDGIFGPNTEAALEAFQKAHGLQVDGILGPKTRAALRLP
jgi:hypothetical protein